MVNLVKLENLLRTLQEYVTHLQNLGQLDRDEVLSDPYKRGAARYYLQVAIECSIDIGNHVIASEQLQSPTTYRETFQILYAAGIIPDEMASSLQQMTSMRNRLVHMYSEIDDEIVFEAILTAPADCNKFVEHILNYRDLNTDRQSTNDQ